MTARPGHFSRLMRDADGEVTRLRAALPEEIRSAAEDVTVVCQMLPEPDLLLEDEDESDLLGLFVGENRNELGGDNPVPPQIYLFLENIWEEAQGDPRVFRREVRKTYLHELGHYLGLGEDDLTLRGLE
jgi:predicted Zn-dependent protease with MMP-like domain